MSGDARRRKPPGIVMPPAPDLQALVTQYGGYHRIPNEAWAKHYNEMITVHVWLAMRHIPKHTPKRRKRKIKISNP